VSLLGRDVAALDLDLLTVGEQTVGEQAVEEQAGGGRVSIRDVCKRFGTADGNGTAVDVLDHVSLDVSPGEFVCLVGASGCGKSTLLSMLAGLDRPTSGAVEVTGGPATLVFQEAALFPWLTVQRNIELALKLSGVSRGARPAAVADLLELVHLSAFAGRRPHELSGGMRQRVALARALAQQARILLMDEPFGALDAMARDLLHEEVERLWLERGFTVVFVTHNVREAVRLADRVVLLSSRPGRIVEEFRVGIDRPRRIESPAVATLAGRILDRLRGEVRRHGRP
jgi:NitT/TauT family transport system ATP-binding protein